jgi:hypothetical protein
MPALGVKRSMELKVLPGDGFDVLDIDVLHEPVCPCWLCPRGGFSIFCEWYPCKVLQALAGFSNSA